ncbi:MAG: molecular chaperone DnaJ [Armatimonadetes bacterium]|nr:molecular chaperone DnaJ [Armatimonadota bacterium]MDE2205386.1 molecular chaperone DnaJ [Armatimonadota bacterium]
MATTPRDYYDVLGVERHASSDDVKRAYRNLAKKLHPDVNKAADAPDRFKEVQEAYDVLSNEDRRRSYDQFGHAGVNGGASGFPGDSPFSDIFDAFFGERTASRGPAGGARGDDLRADVRITLEEAARGCEVPLKISRMETCEKCTGSGANPGSAPTVCGSCNGTGQVRHSTNTILGTFVASATCRDCGGTGQLIASPCDACRGSGRVRNQKQRTVKVPAGIDTGMRLRLAGDGDAGERGGPSGDLYVVISVDDHEVFRRDGTELYCTVEISFPVAALGGVVPVPTLDGDEELTIPSGTQPGTEFTLRGHGLPVVQGRGKGDEHVLLQVSVPRKLSDEQRELLKQFSTTLGEDPGETGDNRGLLGRIFKH